LTSTHNISNIADSYGIFTYKDPLVYFGIEDHGNWRHRELALKLDPYIKAYIKRFDEELLAELPVTTPDIFGQQQQQQEQDTQVQEEEQSLAGDTFQEENISIDEESTEPAMDVLDEWINERFSQLIIKSMDKSRVHSYCVIKLYNEAPWWRVFCEREIVEIYYSNEGNPTGCKVQWSRALPKSSDFMNYEEEITFYDRTMDLELKENTSYGLFVPFKTPESNEDLGEYDLADKWSTSIFLRYTKLDVVNNSAKSSGFYWIKYASGIQDTARQSLMDALDAANRCQSVGASGNVIEDVKDIHAEKPEFSLDALADLRMEFAMSCRLPLSYFRSESESNNILGGNQSGDEIKINKRKEHLFAQFKPYLIDLIYMRWGIQIDDIQPYIVQSENDQIMLPFMKGNEDKNEQINGNKMELIK
jgi:hypothetical protein